MKRFWRQNGVASSEQMLVISVIAIASVAAGYVYVPTFQSGTNLLSHDVSSILSTHDIGGIGLSGNPNPGGSGGSGDASNGGFGNPSNAPPVVGSGPVNTSNCSGNIMVSQCGGNSTGSGGGGTPSTPGVSPADIAIVQNPSSTSAQVQQAEANIIAGASHTCSQVALAQILGLPVNQVIVQTITGGLTNPNTTTVSTQPPVFSFFDPFGMMGGFPGMMGGMGMFNNGPPQAGAPGTVTFTSGYDGYMSLSAMKAFLGQYGVASSIVHNVSVGSLESALANNQHINVIIDADSSGNVLTNGHGYNGHTVTVTGVSADGSTVTYTDANGTHVAPSSVFVGAIHDDKMLTTADNNHDSSSVASGP